MEKRGIITTDCSSTGERPFTILFLSDLHGSLELLQRILRRAPHADLVLDGGDSCLAPAVLAPALSVRGNCDRDLFPFARLIRVNGLVLLLVHGTSLDHDRGPLVRLAHELEASVVLHGHCHRVEDVMHDGIRFISPGSPVAPRDGARGYLWLTVSLSARLACTWKEITHE